MATLEMYVSRLVSSLLDIERVWGSVLKMSKWGAS